LRFYSTPSSATSFGNAAFGRLRLRGAVYLFHIFSRADFHHLAEGSAPFLIGLLAFISFFKKKRQKKFVTAIAIFFFLLSVTAVGLLDPFASNILLPKTQWPYALWRR